MTIQRNDPCHCGSGKKYKKCCMKLDKAKATLARSSTDVRSVVTSQTIPYAWWKIWRTARMRSDYALLYDLTHEEGDFRARFKSREDFYTKSQVKPLPSGEEWRIEKIKLDEVTAYILSSRGQNDPRVSFVDLEMMELRRIPEGWRLYDVKTTRKEKPSGSQSAFIAFDDFGINSAEAAFRQRVEEGYVRPDYADREDEEEEVSWDAPEEEMFEEGDGSGEGEAGGEAATEPETSEEAAEPETSEEAAEPEAEAAGADDASEEASPEGEADDEDAKSTQTEA